MLGELSLPAGDGHAGKFQVLGKYAQANFSEGITAVDPDYDQKTTEINFNYIIKDFNARVMIFFKNTRFNAVQHELQAGRRRPADPDVRPAIASALSGTMSFSRQKE